MELYLWEGRLLMLGSHDGADVTALCLHLIIDDHDVPGLPHLNLAAPPPRRSALKLLAMPSALHRSACWCLGVYLQHLAVYLVDLVFA